LNQLSKAQVRNYLPGVSFAKLSIFNISNTWGGRRRRRPRRLARDGEGVCLSVWGLAVNGNTPREIEELLRSQGGYANPCLQTGRLENPFSVDDARDQLEASSHRGLWMAPMLLAGFDATGKTGFESGRLVNLTLGKTLSRGFPIL